MSIKPRPPKSFTLAIVKAKPRIDSRLLAMQLANRPKAVMALVDRYADKFKAFGEARRSAGQHGAEYLPTYHQLHEELHALAAGSVHAGRGAIPSSEGRTRRGRPPDRVSAHQECHDELVICNDGAGAGGAFMMATPIEITAGGFQSHSGAEAMITVNATSTPRTGNAYLLTRQQAIENALSMALYHARCGDIHTSTGRAIRATSLLKQACAEMQIGGSA